MNEVLLIICVEYEKIDENVCLGAVHEYEVKKFFLINIYFGII